MQLLYLATQSQGVLAWHISCAVPPRALWSNGGIWASDYLATLTLFAPTADHPPFQQQHFEHGWNGVVYYTCINSSAVPSLRGCIDNEVGYQLLFVWLRLQCLYFTCNNNYDHYTFKVDEMLLFTIPVSTHQLCHRSKAG